MVGLATQLRLASGFAGATVAEGEGTCAVEVVGFREPSAGISSGESLVLLQSLLLKMLSSLFAGGGSFQDTFQLGDGSVLNSVHLILVVLCYISARGFVHNETFGGRGGFVCHFIELRSSLLHVAVEAPDVAAVPRFPIVFFLLQNVSVRG